MSHFGAVDDAKAVAAHRAASIWVASAVALLPPQIRPSLGAAAAVSLSWSVSVLARWSNNPIRLRPDPPLPKLTPRQPAGFCRSHGRLALRTRRAPNGPENTAALTPRYYGRARRPIAT
jgi:hypothetical protein